MRLFCRCDLFCPQSRGLVTRNDMQVRDGLAVKATALL
jgi:hypothetical protein